MFAGTFIKNPKHLESSLMSGEFLTNVEKCVNTKVEFSVDKVLSKSSHLLKFSKVLTVDGPVLTKFQGKRS